MSYKKIIIISAAIFALAGCAHQNDYLKEAQTVPLLVMPANAKIKNAENYYPIPAVPTDVTASPSQLPPGSDLGRFKRQKAQPVLSEPTQTVHVTN